MIILEQWHLLGSLDQTDLKIKKNIFHFPFIWKLLSEDGTS